MQTHRYRDEALIKVRLAEFGIGEFNPGRGGMEEAGTGAG